MWVSICGIQPPIEAFGWPYQPSSCPDFRRKNTRGNTRNFSPSWWPHRGLWCLELVNMLISIYNQIYWLVYGFWKEEKLEPLRNITDDPRIRLLNRLYAKKRKELKERQQLRVIAFFPFYFIVSINVDVNCFSDALTMKNSLF